MAKQRVACELNACLIGEPLRNFAHRRILPYTLTDQKQILIGTVAYGYLLV